MPRFDYNPMDTSAGFPVYPKGAYEVTLGEPKTFYGAGKNGKADNFGIGFLSKVTDAEDPKWKGKKYYPKCFFHTPDSMSMGKVLQMAALGFAKNQEDEFDAEYGKMDWGFNTDDGTVGEAWLLMKGQTVIFDLDTGINQETGEPNQKQVGVRPLR